METIRGRTSREMNMHEFRQTLTRYAAVQLDLGTGDGRYVSTLAAQQPRCFVIGVDACRENLRDVSRRCQPNALYVIAEAQCLPPELCGLASAITINFPWGSLLDSLLCADPALMLALRSAAAPQASLNIRLNAGALEEAGTALEAGADRVHGSLLRHGWRVAAPCPADRASLQRFPSTWARRLAHGRDPRAMEIAGRLIA